MKAIVAYLHEYFRQERGATVVTAGALLLGAFVVNYGYLPESRVIRSIPHPVHQVLFYAAFYTIPFMVTVAAAGVFRRDFSVFRTARFWRTTLFCLALLAVYVVLHRVPYYLLGTREDLYGSVPAELRLFAARCLSNSASPVLAAVPLAAYWWLYDRSAMKLYGLDSSRIRLRTYFLILALLIPVLVAVSFTQDFQTAYPRYRFGWPGQAWTGNRGALASLFEFCYGSDFVFVEFFFRGFMVLGLSRALGGRSDGAGSPAILPMVVVYALFHFEKPLLEAVGSIFGGLVLGVIAHRTRSIYGGIILHLGVAAVMELAGAVHFAGGQ